LRAASDAFRIASETSFALPNPQPTIPSWSPATISALKLKRRPPFTTFAQRLIKTTFSVVSPLAAGVLSALRESDRLPVPGCAIKLKFQTAFAGRVRQNFDFPVIKKSTAVENDVVDLFREGAFRNGFADRRRRYTVGRGFTVAEQ
jgi:hypothetical protein